MNAAAAFALLKETFHDWQEDKASRLAASLAYYAIFSLGPLLLIVIAIAGLVFGQEAARGAVVGQIQGLVGQEGAQVTETAIQHASDVGGSIISAVIGITLLVVGATGVFGQLQDALNTIWEVEPKPGRGLLGTIKDRFLSMTMVLGVGFLLLVSLVISAALAALGNWLGGLVPGFDLIGQAINFVISLAVVTLLFAMIYKILPDVKIGWRDVWIGAFATALLFTIGKLLIGLYLGRASISSTFGAAGSVVVLLVWIYYSAQILFFGAEFTQVYARRYGTRIVPEEDARPVTEEQRAQQGMPHDEQPSATAESQPARPERQPGAAHPAPPGHAQTPSDGHAKDGGSLLVRGAAIVATGALLLLRLRARRQEQPRQERARWADRSL